MKMVFVISALTAMVFAALAACSLDPSLSSLADGNDITSADLGLDLGLAARRADAMGVGSPCAGSEGAWFCMSSSFQRCASGRWTAAVACAPGTVCQPEGLTYDLQSAFGIAPAPTSTTGAETQTESIAPASSKKTTGTTATIAATTTAAAKTKSCSSDAASTTCTMGAGMPKKDSSDAPRRGVGCFSWALICAGGMLVAGVMI